MEPVKLGHHELLLRLAAGGAANVFLVRDTSKPTEEKLLALKILLPSLAQNEDFVRMFFSEAKIAARLRHQNVVAIAGFGQVEGIYCLAMEYVFGASLAQVLRASARAKKPLTVGVLLRITAAVCDALHHAHELEGPDGKPLRLVHRDVTPQNILIGFNGVPKLTDFGIAKATNRGWETQAGIVKGKFSYMSPEQALGKKVDRRSDIFGTGIVLWEALTGRDLFKGTSPMEVLSNIRSQKIIPPSKVVPGLTPIVDPIVMKALKRNPRSRYQSAAEMRDDIEDLIRRAGVEINSETISREFATIYGEDIVERAFALRAAMAGRGDPAQLAKVLGGSVLEKKHLPIIEGGLTDPDPLGLFTDKTPDLEVVPEEQEVMPARMERPFSGAGSSIEIDDFEIVEDTEGYDENDQPEEYPAFDAEPTGDNNEDNFPPDRLLTGWEDSVATNVPDDELLSMISEEDATIGYLPQQFAERFGDLTKAPPDEESFGGFEEELTVGMPGGAAAHSAGRYSSTNGSSPWNESQTPSLSSQHKLQPLPAAPSRRPIPRAPSLDLDGNEAPRSVPRAPSLDLDERPLEAGARPDVLDSRPPPKRPPPPPPERGGSAAQTAQMAEPNIDELGGFELDPLPTHPPPEEAMDFPEVSSDIPRGSSSISGIASVPGVPLIPETPPPGVPVIPGTPPGVAPLSAESLRAIADGTPPSVLPNYVPPRPRGVLMSGWLLFFSAVILLAAGAAIGLVLARQI